MAEGRSVKKSPVGLYGYDGSVSIDGNEPMAQFPEKETLAGFKIGMLNAVPRRSAVPDTPFQ